MMINNSLKNIVKSFLVASVFVTTTYASETYSKVDRIKDMLTMANAMEMIQKGLIFRCENNECTKNGIDKIKKVLHTIDRIDSKDFLDNEQLYAHKFAKKTRVMLKMYLDEMEDEIRRGNQDEVIHNYSLVLRQCTSCHMRLRK